MKKFISIILVLIFLFALYFLNYTLSKKYIINQEILNFEIKNIKLGKSETNFLDANYINCGTSLSDKEINDTIWNGEIKYDYKKVNELWEKKFRNNRLESVKNIDKVGVNKLNNLDKKNLYKLILNSYSQKSNPFSSGFKIFQTITYKKNDTLKVLNSEKEYWWKYYKWELTKKKEVQYSYFKMY